MIIMNLRSLKRLNTQPQYGFTMLEVVIAMAIGAIGIVAFAGLQLKAGEISVESRQRTIAAFIAEEAAERMSSNSQDLGAVLVYQGVGGFWGATPADQTGFSDGIYCEIPCDAGQMATADIQNLKSLARSSLPNGNITHRRCGGGVPASHECIIVTWDDADSATCGIREGSSDLDDDRQGLDECYILQVKIW